MKNVKLAYGMKLLHPAYPITYHVPLMGISITSIGSNDKPIETEFTVEKYWDNDTNPNSYKVKLVPSDPLRFSTEKLYSSDLCNSIKRGHTKILN